MSRNCNPSVLSVPFRSCKTLSKPLVSRCQLWFDDPMETGSPSQGSSAHLMKTNLRYIPLAALSLFLGCGTPGGHIKPGEPSKISIGMTKEQVLRILGNPENVNADAHSETLSYILERPWWQDKPFQVKLVDGKVVSFEVIEH